MFCERGKLANGKRYVYHARMGSERESIQPPDRQRRHIETMAQFDRELDALIYPITEEDLKTVTKNLLIRTFGYDDTMAETRTNILAKEHDIPSGEEIEDEEDSLIEMLKVGLFDMLPEEYIILLGKDEFDEWIGPFLSSVLLGHIEESASMEHRLECVDQFCSSRVIRYMLSDRLSDNAPRIHRKKAENEGYLPYADELIYMNVRIVEELYALGVYNEVDTKSLLADYQWWLEELEDLQINYDTTLFEDPDIYG